MTQPFRLPTGGRIARSRPLRFTFDGRSYEGYAGDTLASALLANGVHLVGRSFKYHRPRGILSAGSEEPNALMTIDRGAGRVTPNLRATQIELYDGLCAISQNRWPSLDFDLGAASQFVSRLLPAGFYYKTFMWPRAAWRRVYEPLIRRAAGLGKAPRAPDPDRYTNQFAHCDVLVIGAGPAGLEAALRAGRAGSSVILCDEQQELGGSLLNNSQAAERLMQYTNELRALPNVRLLRRTTAFGVFAQNFVALAERINDHLPASNKDMPRERLWQVRAERIVIATGAIERPLVFPGNDRPGVMLAHAGLAYVNRYGVLPGKQVVIATTNDDGYAVADALKAAGAEIATIVDLRRDETIAATHGGKRISSVDIRLPDNSLRRIACDLLLMSGGWTPSVHLFSQARGKLRFDVPLQCFVPDGTLDAIECVGGCAGAGLQPSPATQIVADGKSFVDFQNDVTSADIELAVREGFRSVEHIKRYTTSGMATDQGKTSNMNALAIAAATIDAPVGSVGTTTFRQPFTPVTFGTLAGLSRGALFEPVRTLPSHDWALAHGAVFEDAGQWKRASYFSLKGEGMCDAVMRECRTVRAAAGIFDASSLGKIEISGPDALAFLNRIYINDFSRLDIGRCRYALMLNEAGLAMDDGIVGRLAETRFHVTTTSGGIGHVLHHMEDFLQTEFTSLQVWLTDVTEQWSTFAVQGPRARDIVGELTTTIDLSPGSMSHMSLREGSVCDADARLMRVSFTGECGYEINVPSSEGARVWAALYESASRHDASAYGLEALNVLRAEKGYIIVGQETDGSTTPDDLGFGKMIGARKDDFVGKRSLSLAHLASSGRKQLVGLKPLDPQKMLEEGAQITLQSGAPTGSHAVGHVTTACWSAVLDRSIALALVENGRALIGSTLHVPMPNGDIPVEVTSPVFVDPAGARLHG